MTLYSALNGLLKLAIGDSGGRRAVRWAVVVVGQSNGEESKIDREVADRRALHPRNAELNSARGAGSPLPVSMRGRRGGGERLRETGLRRPATAGAPRSPIPRRGWRCWRRPPLHSLPRSMPLTASRRAVELDAMASPPRAGHPRRAPPSSAPPSPGGDTTAIKPTSRPRSTISTCRAMLSLEQEPEKQMPVAGTAGTCAGRRRRRSATGVPVASKYDFRPPPRSAGQHHECRAETAAPKTESKRIQHRPPPNRKKRPLPVPPKRPKPKRRARPRR